MGSFRQSFNAIGISTNNLQCYLKIVLWGERQKVESYLSLVMGDVEKILGLTDLCSVLIS